MGDFNKSLFYGSMFCDLLLQSASLNACICDWGFKIDGFVVVVKGNSFAVKEMGYLPSCHI